jgi:fused-like protein
MIFINPTPHSDEELLLAVKFLRSKNVAPDFPLAASFAFHFRVFIGRQMVLGDALYLATDLLRKDFDRFAVPFAAGVGLLGDGNMPEAAIDFFTQLLTIPFAQNIVRHSDFQLGDLQLDQPKGRILRDKLMTFMFSDDQELVSKTYCLLSFFVQESNIILAAFSEWFAPQIIPTLISVICFKAFVPIRCAAFCVLARVLDHNPIAIKYIDPFSQFLDAFHEIAVGPINRIEEFCLFSAAVSLIAVTLGTLVEVPEFSQKYSIRTSLSTLPALLNLLFMGKSTLEDRLEILLTVASVRPKTECELMCYSTVLSSPFHHIPMKETFIEPCCEAIVAMVPMHQPALLGTLLALQPHNVIPYLPSLVPLYGSPSCASILSDFILEVLAIQTPQTEYLVGCLCDNGILSMISSLICEVGPMISPNVVLVLVQIVMTFEHPTQLLVKEAPEVLNSIFSLESALESALIIASHLARISKDFLVPLSDSGALNIAEKALQSPIPQVRSKGLDFIGNICRYVPLPGEYRADFMSLLMCNLMDTDRMCQKLAALAIGNVLATSPEVGTTVMLRIDFVKMLLKSDDPKTVENAARLLGNLVRKSDKHVAELIQEGAVQALVNTLETCPKLEGRTILPIAAFCQYEEGTNHLKTIDAQELVAKYKDADDARVKRYANSVIALLSSTSHDADINGRKGPGFCAEQSL